MIFKLINLNCTTIILNAPKSKISYIVSEMCTMTKSYALSAALIFLHTNFESSNMPQLHFNNFRACPRLQLAREKAMPEARRF